MGYTKNNSSRAEVINQLSFLELHGPDRDRLQNFVRDVYSVGPEAISQIARSELVTGEMVCVVVGDRASLLPQLKLVEARQDFAICP